MMVRLFMAVVFVVIGLSTTLVSMKNGDEYLLEKFEQLRIVDGKIYEDFSYHDLDSSQKLVTTKFDKDHDIVVIKRGDCSFKFILHNTVTNLRCVFGKILEPTIKKNTVRLFVNDKKELFVFYEDNSSQFERLKIKFTDYIDFPQEENYGYSLLLPVKMISFELADKKIFKVIMTTYGSGFFGIYEDRFSESSYTFDEKLGKIRVTDIDAIKVDDESFVIAFVFDYKRIYLFYWKVGGDAQYLEAFSMENGVEKVILNKEIKKIKIKLKKNKIFYIDFSESIKQLLN